MATSAVDLFKFVSLRSPAEVAVRDLIRTHIVDERLGAPARDDPPDVAEDSPNFGASRAATEIYAAVREAVEQLSGPAAVPAANRAVAGVIAGGDLRPPPVNRSRIDRFRIALQDSAEAPFSGIVEAVDTVAADGGPRTNDIVRYASRPADDGRSLLADDMSEAFDSLYRAYVAKQVKAVNLEDWIERVRTLHVVRGLAAGKATKSGPDLPDDGPWALATAPAVVTSEDLAVTVRSLPQLHPLFTALVGYYVPFNRIRPVGIGDLLVVKQFLCAYEAGEIAHVENVLRGESKTRKHRRLDRTEDTFTQESETIEETTRELQTTDRFELKAESDSTIQNDLSAEVSGQVSGRYGVVEVSATAGVSYTQSTVDSRRSSNNFAKDVLDRSLSRIQKRTRQERVTKQTHEVEETNTHGLDNVTGKAHVCGIYRWLDKRYKAQVYNYGKRLMFEFVVPEPAAFVLSAFERSRRQESRPQIPQPPARPELVMSSITQATVDAYGQVFPLGDVKAEPEPALSVSDTIAAGGIGAQTATAHQKVLNVPEGYYATGVTVSGGYEGIANPTQGSDWGVFVSVGGKNLVDTSDDGTIHVTYETQSATFNPPLDGPIAVSVYAYRVHAFSIGVELQLVRKPSTLRTWQIDVYKRIMDGYAAARSSYDSQMAEYEDKLEGFKVSQGIAIRGRNPRVNQEVIRTELKKCCLSMVARQFDSDKVDDVVFDGMGERDEEIDEEALTRTERTTVVVTTPNPGETVKVTTKMISDAVTTAKAPVKLPAVDLVQANEEGPIVQFLEQAFEWQQINYVFYPYFWGKLPEKWFDAQRYYDEEDPLYAKFLQAGSARILVAVRPGFEGAVMHYLATRQPWNGGPAPTIDDPLYLAVHEEIRDQQDDLNGATPYGEPWYVVVPTSLVYLEPTATLPTYDCTPGEPA